MGVYELPSTLNRLSSSPIPFRLHAALSADNQAIVVLFFKHLKGAPPDVSSRNAPPVEFDVVAVRVPLQTANDINATSPLDILWHRRGTNVPLYTAYDKHRGVSVLIGGSSYRHIRQSDLENHEHSPDENAPIPRVSTDDVVPVPTSTSPPKPPPYVWSQDSEEVTVVLPYSSNTPKTHINVLFSSQTLTVLVQGSDDTPRYVAARLWGGIAPSSSFWTWDAHGAQAYGLLTLHLEKQHAGTRWPYLFNDSVSTSTSGQTAPPPEQVPETLDPSELYAIRESLEKYTAALQEAGGGGGAALGSSSLTDGEIDEEVDAAVGTQTCITWVAATDGSDPAWAHVDWDVPFTVLSTPLPGISDDISLVVKHAIDGLSFALSDEDVANGTPVWTHLSTFSALAFVLASKRDTRFTYHVPSKAVLAFEGGGIGYGGNLYIYRGAEPKSNLAKQAILKLTGSTSGSLLGAGAIRKDEESIILCLCEKELLILRNML
jgi:CS domain-containing protein